MRSFAIASLLWLSSSVAFADVHDLELTLPMSLVDHSTAGIGAAPPGYGYENYAGLMTGAEARLYFDDMFGNDIFHLGVIAGGQYQAGPLLDLVDGYSFATTVIDVGITARVLLPCLSRGDIKWQLSGLIAAVGAYSDAGLGVGGAASGPDFNQRLLASQTLDHGGIGWRLALDLSWRYQMFVIGLGAGLRQYYAIDSLVSRVWLLDLGLRVGFRFDFVSTHTYEVAAL